MSSVAERSARRQAAAHGSVTSSAAIVAFATLLSRILGLLRDMMTARYFSNDVRDAILAAFRLPNFFRRILGEGSLSISFVPIFIEVLRGDEVRAGHQEARQMVSAVFSVMLVFAISLALIGIIFMEDILRVVLSGEAYQAVPGKFALTVQLGRIMFGFVVAISLYAFFMAVLNSQRKFIVAALAPCLFNITMILAAYISPRFAAPERALAWAVLIGGALQMGVLIPAVARSGFLPKISFAWQSPEVRKVLWALGPSLFAASIMQFTALVNMHFASDLPSGAQSYLYLADRLLELPLSLFVVSVSSALLPTLARFRAEGNSAAVSATFNHYFRLILFISIPAGLGLFILAQPIVETLFLGREFKYADAVQTASVLQVYAFTVIVAASVRILAQGFYAIQNTWYPALSGGVSFVSHLVFAYALTKTFGLVGLAAASLCSATVNLLLLAVAYNAWAGKIEGRKLAFGLIRYAICGALMVWALQSRELVSETIRVHLGVGFAPRALALTVLVFFGAIVYLTSALVLRVPECRETLQIARSRFRS